LMSRPEPTPAALKVPVVLMPGKVTAIAQIP